MEMVGCPSQQICFQGHSSSSLGKEWIMNQPGEKFVNVSQIVNQYSVDCVYDILGYYPVLAGGYLVTCCI